MAIGSNTLLVAILFFKSPMPIVQPTMEVNVDTFPSIPWVLSVLILIFQQHVAKHKKYTQIYLFF